jgi:preprotein translocase SecE subunit
VTNILENVKFFFGPFLKEVRSEMSQVVWLDKKKTIALTGVVFVVAILIASFLGIVDWLFTLLVGLIIN